MRKNFVRALGAVALAASLAAQAGTVTSTPAVKVALSGWAYGFGNDVQASNYSGLAGGLRGLVMGASFGTGAQDNAIMVTYGLEVGEGSPISRGPLPGYSLVDGAGYFERRRGDAGIAEQLGRLMTLVADNPTLVDDAAKSTSLQLAVWDLVYDNDHTVTAAGRFSDNSAYDAYADLLLAGAQGVGASRFDVFALERTGSMDLLMLVAKAAIPVPNDTVPEPGSLALALTALAGLAAARRRST